MAEINKLSKRLKPKLILTIILTIVVYIWIYKIVQDIDFVFGERRRGFIGEAFITGLISSGDLYVLFIKPIFVYISGLIIIKNI